MTVFGRKGDPFQQSTCLQLPVDRGPAAGGEALKNIPHNQFIQIDMTLNYMFHLGLPRKCLYTSMINPCGVGALRAPTEGIFLKLVYRHVPGSS